MEDGKYLTTKHKPFPAVSLPGPLAKIGFGFVLKFAYSETLHPAYQCSL